MNDQQSRPSIWPSFCAGALLIAGAFDVAAVLWTRIAAFDSAYSVPMFWPLWIAAVLTAGGDRMHLGVRFAVAGGTALGSVTIAGLAYMSRAQVMGNTVVLLETVAYCLMGFALTFWVLWDADRRSKTSLAKPQASQPQPRSPLSPAPFSVLERSRALKDTSLLSRTAAAIKRSKRPAHGGNTPIPRPTAPGPAVRPVAPTPISPTVQPLSPASRPPAPGATAQPPASPATPSLKLSSMGTADAKSWSQAGSPWPSKDLDDPDGTVLRRTRIRGRRSDKG
ncbi:hypothetical protein [Tessaracoccus sp. OH4464_COT-324]|uniref:hypothetical protein n=1 Tax=Tessaracoccus sp. OH4464_COT-324 TaxID=2491059 RepID=UPI000F642730|nr:hypothetical protein [Tessaracoccus sp. OH4464_COT-324]RRD46804.1 hypothetical protein EII42_05035 [Tessaracoccus sp. OH4464_COT-324]